MSLDARNIGMVVGMKEKQLRFQFSLASRVLEIAAAREKRRQMYKFARFIVMGILVYLFRQPVP